MKVVLLCAGYATRLYPLTENLPKPLLPVADRPILEYILDHLRNAPGIDQVLIVTNHKFASHFEDWAKHHAYPWPIEVLDDQTTSNEDRLGAIGDLAFTLKAKKIGQEDLLVIAGDNLFDFDLSDFIKKAQAKRPHGVIAGYDVKDKELAKQYGLVKINQEGRIAEFFEKPENPPTTMASCGLYWLPRETRVLLDRYLAEGHNSDQPGHYMRWLVSVDRLFLVPLEGHWYDIGDKVSYQRANILLREIQK